MNQTANKLVVTTPTDTTIVLTRTFGAPRDLVFEAFTKAEHIKRWWGCSSMELTTCEMDFREGGTWRYVAKESNGAEYPFRGEYRVIDRPNRLVQTFVFNVEPFNTQGSLEDMVFTEESGRTTITCTATYPSKEARDAMLASEMESGAGQSYDRLEALLPIIRQERA